MIRELQISNYKSINQINLDCSRINVLIGEPNVGKSNILEALDLAYLPSFFNLNEELRSNGVFEKDIKDYFRIKSAADLFHLGNLSKPISIIHPGFSYDVFIKYVNENERGHFEWVKSDGQSTSFSNDLKTLPNLQTYSSPIKPYRYSNSDEFTSHGGLNVLNPPFGNNLIEVIKHNREFLEFIGEIIKDFGFVLNIDSASNRLLIQLQLDKGVVYTVGYEAMADTLKRFIFYIAAIRYNNATVVTLEEPEVHSFPKFVSYMADEIIRNNKSQFFIATHSPYLLNNLIENTPAGELSVFVCGYDRSRFRTIVKKLTSQDLSELLEYGIDIFFNINRYLDDGAQHNS